LNEIETEIESQTVLPFLKIGKAANKNKSGRGGKKQPAKSEPLKITLNGYNIYAGKNNAQNELLTKRARGYDVWLHAKNIHGCHVVIENNQKSGFPPDEVLLRAASLAAGRSKAAGADKVPVDYTFAKNVTKPNGAPLGKVIYTGQYTVFVKPESV
jgi:predicted ribosome quality control (RQC) complex YloA/Tae2 family protein